MRPEEIPGLKESANTIWTPKEMMDLRKTVETIVARSHEGKNSHVLFLVPPNNRCPGPLYEISTMLDTYLRKKNARDNVEITWTTFESSYIQAFDPRLNEVVEKEFQERKVKGFRDYVVKRIEKNKVIYENGQEITYDFLIAFPPYVSSVKYSSLESDERGFIKTNLIDRSVLNYSNIFAPGDAGDFPVKQAFLAFLQGDAVGKKIHSDISSHSYLAGFVPSFPDGFAPGAMCVMEQLNKALFTQVPLRVTHNPQKPLEVDPARIKDYRIGVSPLWRIGKVFLGIYLPMRFKHAEPFHAGLAWSIMELGLKEMSSLLAK